MVYLSYRFLYLSIILNKLIDNFQLDEISMVSNVRLTQMHLRLTQILATPDNCTKTFGGTNILLLGDLLQVVILIFIGL